MNSQPQTNNQRTGSSSLNSEHGESLDLFPLSEANLQEVFLLLEDNCEQYLAAGLTQISHWLD